MIQAVEINNAIQLQLCQMYTDKHAVFKWQ